MTSLHFKLISSLFLTIVLLASCREHLSVEQHIIANLENMEAAAEEGRHLDFMSYVADDFGAQYGSMDRRGFHRFMILQINENRRLYASFFPIHVRERTVQNGYDIDEELAATGASAQFQVLVTGGVGWLPERGQLFEVETDWILEDGSWLLLKADWETVRMPD